MQLQPKLATTAFKATAEPISEQIVAGFVNSLWTQICY
jgi:hypothetical protein